MWDACADEDVAHYRPRWVVRAGGCVPEAGEWVRRGGRGHDGGRRGKRAGSAR